MGIQAWEVRVGGELPSTPHRSNMMDEEGIGKLQYSMMEHGTLFETCL